MTNDSNSIKWCSPKLWLIFFHYILEEEVLTTCRNINNWENRENIDGISSASRPKKLFELSSNNFNDLECVLICMMSA